VLPPATTDNKYSHATGAYPVPANSPGQGAAWGAAATPASPAMRKRAFGVWRLRLALKGYG